MIYCCDCYSSLWWLIEGNFIFVTFPYGRIINFQLCRHQILVNRKSTIKVLQNTAFFGSNTTIPVIYVNIINDTPSILYVVELIDLHDVYVTLGTTPDGEYDRNTRINFCCRNDGSATRAIELPTTSPFHLLKSGDQCQKVKKKTMVLSELKENQSNKKKRNLKLRQLLKKQ